MRLVVLKGPQVCVPYFSLVLVLEHGQFTITTSLVLVEVAFVGLFFLVLNPKSMLKILVVLPIVLIFLILNLQNSLTMKCSSLKLSFIHSSVMPLKFPNSVFLSFLKESFVDTCITLLHSFSMRMFVKPFTLIFEIGVLVGVYACAVSSSNEITTVVIHKYAVVQIWLKVLVNFALIETCEISILFQFIDLHITSWQLVFELRIFVGVNDVVGLLNFPYFVVALCQFGQSFDILFHFVIGNWQQIDFSSDGGIFPDEVEIELVIFVFESLLCGNISGILLMSLVTFTASSSHILQYLSFNFQIVWNISGIVRIHQGFSIFILFFLKLFYKHFQNMEIDNQDLFFVPIHKHPQWEDQIVPFLNKFTHGDIPNNQIVAAINFLHDEFCFKREAKVPFGRKPKILNFKVLKRLYENELPYLLKDLAAFLLNYRPPAFPILQSNKMMEVQFKKVELFYLVVLMFMGLIPEQVYDNIKFKGRFHDHNTFSQVLSYSEFKTKCIVEYLKKAVKEVSVEKGPIETFKVIRNVTEGQVYQLVKTMENKDLSKITIESDTTSIEEFTGEIKTDFANRYIGGGCLRGGCVQEQIMFAIRPELYAVTLLCEKMNPNESLFFKGFRQHFNYKGYGDKTTYDGEATVKYDKLMFKNEIEYDEKIVAIDAIKFRKGDNQQYHQTKIDREIMKAYTGFSSIKSDAKIVTGGWGCGVYNGDFVLKVMIQWIAASLAGKEIVICPFGRKTPFEKTGIVKLMRNKTIGQAYRLLCEAGNLKAKNNMKEGIMDVIYQLLNKEQY